MGADGVKSNPSPATSARCRERRKARRRSTPRSVRQPRQRSTEWPRQPDGAEMCAVSPTVPSAVVQPASASPGAHSSTRRRYTPSRRPPRPRHAHGLRPPDPTAPPRLRRHYFSTGARSPMRWSNRASWRRSATIRMRPHRRCRCARSSPPARRDCTGRVRVAAASGDGRVDDGTDLAPLSSTGGVSPSVNATPDHPVAPLRAENDRGL